MLGLEIDSERFYHFSHPLKEKYNPLWLEYINCVERIFEWDSYGRFIPIEFDDNIDQIKLSKANLSGIDLEGSYLYNIDFSNSDLSSANLKNTILIDINFTNANLSRVDFRDAIIYANMKNTNFYMSRLDRVNFCGSNLSNANLKRAKLKKADLSYSNLEGVNIDFTQFDRTNLNS
ncbi:MAG: hypothetical protein GF383_16250, partial [Candidatus Lokiarchaeota archaeon]|nr:hypothetical protein [Candidatus Lokiarchaeota archaeon]